MPPLQPPCSARRDGHASAEGFQSNRVTRKRTFRRIGVHHADFCYEGLVRNISSTGALIDGLWDVPAETRFSLQFDNDLFVGAIARWSHENRMGVEFDHPIELTGIGEAGKFKVETGWSDRADENSGR